MPPSPQPRAAGAYQGDWMKSIEDRLDRIEKIQAITIRFTDEDTGVVRMVNGLQDDGSWGIRIWDASGTNLVYDQTV